MAVPTHRYLLRHGPGADVRVTINDFPVHAGRTSSQDSHYGVINHWLVPGTNKMRVDILDGDPKNPAAMLNLDARGADAEPRAFISWLAGKGAVTPLPGHHWAGEATFEPDDGVPEPMWLAAKPERVPPEGTPEIWDEVRGLRRAFETADASAVVEAFALKAVDTHQMIQLPWSTVEKTRELMTSTLDVPWEVKPIAEKDVVFRSFAEDRLVHVGRTDGAALLSARRLGPGEPVKVATELVFMRWDGRWRIIR